MALNDYMEKLNEIDLSDIDFSRAGMWPRPAKVALLVVIFILASLGSYFFIVNPQLTQWEKVKEEEVTLRKQFETRALQASNIEDLRAQNAELVMRFEALLKQLPSDTEVPGLLEDITSVGVNGGLTIEKIELKKETKQEFFIELPMAIRLRGNYHNLGAFVSGVAALPRIVTLHDFDIKPVGNTGDLSLQINAKTYRYKD